MALINCPECNHQISDRATSCPECGYPLPEPESIFAEKLIKDRWELRSFTIGADTLLVADFNDDGSFDGMLNEPPDSVIRESQMIKGKWHVNGSLLFIGWDYMQQGAPFHSDVTIELSDQSDDSIEGVDKWFRRWTFTRSL